HGRRRRSRRGDVDQERQPGRAAAGQQVPLDVTLGEVIVDLVDLHGGPTRYGGQLDEFRDVEAGDPPVPDPALGHQQVDRPDDLLQRHRAASVYQVQVDPIRGQPAQALLAGAQDVVADR